MTDQYKAEAQKLFGAADHFLPAGAMIAGGALTSVFTGQPINDVDLYFRSRASFEQAIHDAYDDGLWCVAVSSRSVTFARGSSIIQMMHFDWFADAAAVFDCFDFTACMAAYDCETKDFVFHPDFWKHAAQRFLRFHGGTRYPFASLLRVLKYQQRGYTIGKSDLLRIALACHRTPLNSWDDLAEQVGGAYGEKVAIVAEGEFSQDAAIAALNGVEITAPAASEEMPGTAETLLARIFGEPEKLVA